jgi:mannose-6-phosphate isomerase-like protein (cupin superfamily)
MAAHQKKDTATAAPPVRTARAKVKSASLSEEEQANAHALHTAAITDAQEKKNRTKTASHFLHSRRKMTSGTISEEEQANAHTMHMVAIKDAQVKKNDAKVVSHNLHNQAGVQAYTVSDEGIASDIRHSSHDAKTAARNPHHHTGVRARKDPGHQKSGTRKTGKNGFVTDLEEETRKNKDFRRVLYTGKYSQIVLMSLKPGEDIGFETHGDVDQFFRFEEGSGTVEIDGTSHMVKEGSGVIVPCGAMHNVTNTAEEGFLKLYTIYSPPEHQDKVIRKTKWEAHADEEHFDGKTTEKYR